MTHHQQIDKENPSGFLKESSGYTMLDESRKRAFLLECAAGLTFPDKETFRAAEGLVLIQPQNLVAYSPFLEAAYGAPPDMDHNSESSSEEIEVLVSSALDLQALCSLNQPPRFLILEDALILPVDKEIERLLEAHNMDFREATHTYFFHTN